MKKKNTKRTIKTSLLLGVSLFLVFALVMPAIAANDSNAVYTTDSTGAAVNGNQFSSKQDVYIRFGSQLPDGNWNIVVSQPGGSVLGTGVQVVSSASRVFQLWTITEYGDSLNEVYKVEASIQYLNDKGKETTIQKSDNFKVALDPDGDDPDGDDPDGDDPDGDDPDGDDPDGDDPDGDDPDGDDPDGDDPDGDDPDGDDEDADDTTKKVRRPRTTPEPTEEILDEETPLVVPVNEPEEEVAFVVELEEESIVPEQVPLALPNTGASTDSLMLFPVILALASYVVAKKTL